MQNFGTMSSTKNVRKKVAEISMQIFVDADACPVVDIVEKIAKKLTDLVGNTPLLELSNYNKSNDLKARLIVKIESFNPAGSVKDRIALAMVEDAETKGLSLIHI